MAARKNRGAAEGWDQSVRERIKTSMLLNRLQDHVFGKCELSATQIRAAEITLNKSLPNLTASESKQTIEHRYVARLPAPVESAEEWHRLVRPLAPPTITH